MVNIQRSEKRVQHLPAIVASLKRVRGNRVLVEGDIEKHANVGGIPTGRNSAVRLDDIWTFDFNGAEMVAG